MPPSFLELSLLFHVLVRKPFLYDFLLSSLRFLQHSVPKGSVFVFDLKVVLIVGVVLSKF